MGCNGGHWPRVLGPASDSARVLSAVAGRAAIRCWSGLSRTGWGDEAENRERQDIEQNAHAEEDQKLAGVHCLAHLLKSEFIGHVLARGQVPVMRQACDEDDQHCG